MQDRFYGKTWIFWAQLFCGLGLGGFAVFNGLLFWAGIAKDALNKPRPQAGPPMVIIGSCLLAIAALAAFNIIGRLTPLIRCCREGIEYNLVGASMDGMSRAIRLLQLAWAIVSLQGFQSHRVRIPWNKFRGAHVDGVPMAFVLIVSGTGTNLKTGEQSDGIGFRQAVLQDDPRQVADILNAFAKDAAQRNQLPPWS